MIDKEKIRNIIELFIAWNGETEPIDVANIDSAVEFICSSLQEEPVSTIWHNANETPKGAGDKEILVQFADSHASVLEIDDWEYLDHQTKWAYLEDLT